jgi:hypothetical protein
MREKCMLRVLANRALRRISGPKKNKVHRGLEKTT